MSQDWTVFLQEMIRTIVPVLLGALMHRLGVNGWKPPDPKAKTVETPGGGA